jgi:beta-ketoacyl-acyl-carrier-protein synthase II
VEDHRRRVVITGLGVITSLGSDLEQFWASLLAGKSGVRPITLFDASGLPCQIAGEIPDFVAEEHIPGKQARRMARTTQIGLAAVQFAVTDSGLEVPLTNPERVGVSFGTAIGGLDHAFMNMEKFKNSGLARVNPFAIPASIPNMASFHVAVKYNAVGPNKTIVTACATGTQAVGEGSDFIRYGKADIVLAGGTEALIQDFTLAGFASMRALPTNYNDDPASASRPFDAKREGFVFSEGAAALVLESLESAKARNAHIYAEVAGHASSSDAYHVAAPDPSGNGAVRTMRWALEDAGAQPEEVEYINAHGTSTPVNDATETLAIKKLFGEHAYNIPISSTKSMIGHAMGASGAIEAAVSALTIERSVIHPTINYEHPDPDCDLDYVTEGARDQSVNLALSNSFGLGGQNACLVLKRVED